MISIQLADAFRSFFGSSEQPSDDLLRRYERATTSIANSFTLKLTENDERYLYARYKKIKNDTGYLEFLKRPHLIYLLCVSLRGYSKSELMQQYIDKVEQLGVNIGESSKRGGFSKGPSKMKENSDSTLSDEDFSNKRAQLFECIRNGEINNVRSLLEDDKQLVNLPYLDIYPIHTAADIGQLDILKLLISLGANVDQRDSDGQTALHYGASNGYCDVVKFLLDAGTDPKIRCNDNLRALDSATDSDIIDLLKSVSE